MHGARLVRRIGALGLLGMIAASGCGRAAARVSDFPARPHAATDTCWLAPPPRVAPDSLLIAVHDPIGHGPGAADFDDGRRLVATLTADDETPADCAGAPIAGATIRWTRDNSAASERYTSTGAPSVVRVVTLDASADPRDALDGGADLLVTTDPAAVAYARALGDRLIVPLEPRWTYGVITARAAVVDSLTLDGVVRLRASLSRDVVPAAARSASNPSAGVNAGCAVFSGTDRAARSRIVHRAEDPVARAIASRLVSLAVSGDSTVRALVPHPGGPLVVAPLDADAFAAALAAGEDAAYVVAWPRTSDEPCVAGRRPQPSSSAGAAGASGAAIVTPLIDAGQWAIVRRGAVGLVTDSRGDPRIVLAVDPLRIGAP